MSSAIEPIAPSAITETVLERNPAAVYLARLTSPHSRRTMQNALNQIADVLQTGLPNDARRWQLIQWAAIRAQHAGAIRARLVELYAPATVNKMQAALRGVLETAYDLDLLHELDYRKAIKALKTVRGETIPAGREIAGGEVLALVQACKADPTPAGARDAAIIAVLYAGGLRRSELVALDYGDVDRETGKLSVRHGKGRKERTVYLQGGAYKALESWLTARGNMPGALFHPIRKDGAIIARRMTDQAAYSMLTKRAEQAGVADFSPHDFRRTFVSELLDRGADIVTVQKMAGHSSPTTTARYDRRPEAAKREAAKLLHFPF